MEDFAGFKLRSPNLEGYIKVWEWMGSAPTPLAMGETYTALQQGTVDGQENSILDSQSYSFQEVCPYWILTNHVYSANTIIMDKAYFESLPEDTSPRWRRLPSMPASRSVRRCWSGRMPPRKS